MNQEFGAGRGRRRKRNDRGNGRGRGRGRRSRGGTNRGAGRYDSGGTGGRRNHRDFSNLVLDILKKSPVPVKTADIAKACGCTKSEVNPSIYSLHRRNVLRKVTQQPPSWEIDRAVADEIEQRESQTGGFQPNLLGEMSVNGPDCSTQGMYAMSSGHPFRFGADMHSLGLGQQSRLPGFDKEGNSSLFGFQSCYTNSTGEVAPRGEPYTQGTTLKEDLNDDSAMDDVAEEGQLGEEEETDDSGSEYSNSGDFSASINERISDLMAYSGSNILDVSTASPYASESVRSEDMAEGSDEVSPSEDTGVNMISESFPNISDNNSRDSCGHCDLGDESIDRNSQVNTVESCEGVISDEELCLEDKILRDLGARFLNSAASFLLVDTTKCKKEEVERALKSLESSKLVGRNGSAWQLSDKGEKYLQSKGMKVNRGKTSQPNAPQENRNVLHPPALGASRGLPLTPVELAQSRTAFGNGSNMLGAVGIGRGAHLAKMAAMSVGRGRLQDTQPTVSGLPQQFTGHKVPSNNSSIFEPFNPFSQQQNQTMGQQFATLGKLANVITTSGSPGFNPPLTPMEKLHRELRVGGKQQTLETSPSFASQVGPTSLVNIGQTLQLQSGAASLGSTRQEALTGMRGQQQVGATSLPPGGLEISTESFAALNKNPISALMEYAQSRHSQARIDVISQQGPSHRPLFVIAAFIGNRQFPGVTCSNKKDGRKEAADVAMRTLIAEGQYNVARVSSAEKSLTMTGSMTHFDKIAALSHQAFNTLIASIPELFAGRKVIAGLVMKRNENDVGIVVSIGTGNRCITGHQLSLEGNTVNDSHAEIITRRGFIRLLYRQLETYEEGRQHELFERGTSGKLHIKSGITFHLYISTAPCGDGALFSPRDAGSSKPLLENINSREHNPTFTSNVQGVLRTKMEGGEGTIPIEADFVVQTFDGIQRGERLRTMSCSDKICRWNVVGMQGALLSHFLEPIYLDSLTLGYLYDHGHLARAVCCRLAKGDTPIDQILPRGYRLNHPWLGRVTACDPPRETQKTKALGINWSFGDQRPEVIDGTLGLCHTGIEKGFFSRVAKRCLYDSFRKLCARFGRDDLLQAQTYNKAKMVATDFQAAKSALLKKLTENHYGPWVSKPIEEEMFS